MATRAEEIIIKFSNWPHHLTREDEDFITDRLNAHDALVSALEAALRLNYLGYCQAHADFHEHKEPADRYSQMIVKIYEQARAALALARGEKVGE